MMAFSTFFSLFLENNFFSPIATTFLIIGGFLLINNYTSGFLIYLTGGLIQTFNFFLIKEYLFGISNILFELEVAIGFIIWVVANGKTVKFKQEDLKNYLYLFVGFLIIFGFSFAIFPTFVGFVGFFDRTEPSLETKFLQYMIITCLLVHGLLLSFRYQQSWIFYGLHKILFIVYLISNNNFNTFKYLLLITSLELGLMINYWIRLNPEEKPKPRHYIIHNKIQLHVNPMFKEIHVQEENV
jgi:hypothetical protein